MQRDADGTTLIPFPSPAWSCAAEEAPPEVKMMPAKAAALTLLKELACAYKELEWLLR